MASLFGTVGTAQALGPDVPSTELAAARLLQARLPAVSCATYIVAGRACAARGLDTQPFLAVSFSVSALLTLPLLVVGDTSWLTAPGGALLVAYLAVVPTVLACGLFNRGPTVAGRAPRPRSVWRSRSSLRSSPCWCSGSGSACSAWPARP